MIFSEFIRKGVEERSMYHSLSERTVRRLEGSFRIRRYRKVALDAGYLKRQITNWSADLEIRGTSRISRESFPLKNKMRDMEEFSSI